MYKIKTKSFKNNIVYKAIHSVLYTVYSLVAGIIYFMTPFWVIDHLFFNTPIAGSKYTPKILSADFCIIIIPAIFLNFVWFFHSIIFLANVAGFADSVDFKTNGPVEIVYENNKPIIIKVYHFSDICYEYNDAAKSDELYQYWFENIFDFNLLYGDNICTRGSAEFTSIPLVKTHWNGLPAEQLVKELSKIDPRDLYKQPSFENFPQPSF